MSQRLIEQLEVPGLVYPVDPAHPDHVPARYRRRARRAEAADARAGNRLADEPQAG